MSLLFIGESAIDALLISLCAAIFEFAAKCFEVFIYLTEIPMVDSSQYNTLVRNVYILVGVVVLFALAFGLLKAMVNPDNSGKSTEETGGIIKNLITSIVILIIVPSIFNFAFGLQSSLINYNTIGKIFGSSSTYSNKTSSTEFIKSQGNTLTNQVFKTFFSPNADYCKSLDLDISTESGYNKCLKEVKVSKAFSWLPFADEEPSLATVYSSVDNNGSFFSYVTFSDSVADGETNFNFLIMLAAGIFLCYVIVSFCFDMGIRLVKLVFYQLIAPIPIMMRVIPDKKMSESFGTWVKICITCYMEVFIRLLAIYFTCYLCNVIIDNTLGAAGTNAGWGVTLFGKAFIIMGLIAFMKESPKLISEVIGVDSSNMSLGIKDKLAKGGFFAAGAMAGGFVTSAIRNPINKWKSVKNNGGSNKKAFTSAIGSGLAGGISAAFRSGKSGLGAKSFADMKNSASKGVAGATNARDARANYKAAKGGTVSGAMKGHIEDLFASGKNFVFDQDIDGLTREAQKMEKLAASYNTFSDGIEQLLEKEQAKGNGSVFLKEKMGLANYAAFDAAAAELSEVKAKFNAGRASEAELREADSKYIKARDDVRDELANLTFEGTDTDWYKKLTGKAKAAIKDTYVSSEKLQTSVLENASSEVVQSIMGEQGNNALEAMRNGVPLTMDSFIGKDKNGKAVKMKDAAKIAQGEYEIKAAQMGKEAAPKGDNK